MTVASSADAVEITRRRSRELVGAAMHRHKPLSAEGISERLFSLAFSGLVYPQIWEDPEIDMEAMALAPGQHIVAIASGGCNVLSYLTAAPVEITAVDLNTAHIALNRLKITAARHLVRYDDFFSFFGNAACEYNVTLFDSQLAAHLDAETRAYWNARDWRGRRRIAAFTRGFYRQGLLGRFIAMGHALARALGGDPKAMLKARSLGDQRAIFERELRPLLRKPVVRKLLDRPAALFGLGIPPAQHEALAEGRPMHEVIEERLERLACGFDLQDNYFAWQAFNRGYAPKGAGPVPPYLERSHYDALRERAGNVRVVNASLTGHLETLPPLSTDRYVLLDAQDWMTDAVLTALWREITRTARPGARVIFRTAGTQTILPGRVPDAILGEWEYRAERSLVLTQRDRSSIYGGFHLYVKAE
jgi:S-adenosylmethionine-diacylglycerol 3-amino-3-carboxypropyl transferase